MMEHPLLLDGDRVVWPGFSTSHPTGWGERGGFSFQKGRSWVNESLLTTDGTEGEPRWNRFGVALDAPFLVETPRKNRLRTRTMPFSCAQVRTCGPSPTMLRWPQEAMCFRSLLQQTLSRRVGLPLLTTLTFSTAVTGAIGAARDITTTHTWSIYNKKGLWSMMGGDGETPAKSGPSGSGTPTTPEKKTKREENRWPLRFSAGATMLPHPDKVHKGGEDSYFIAENEESSGISGVGVADGVGGWADLGVDAGEYSRLLMANAKKEVLSSNPGEVAPIDVIIKAHRETLTQGSSTACVVVFEKDTLHAANLGDSGFVVVRDEDIAFKSPAQQHGFNFPYQLGCDVGSDPPQVSDVHNVKLQQGDMIVLGTDGLFDNIFDEEVAALATVARKKGLDPIGVAGVLASAAQNRGADRFCVSPFSVGAREAGFFYQGGKLDDVTVVVVFVEQAQSKL